MSAISVLVVPPAVGTLPFDLAAGALVVVPVIRTFAAAGHARGFTDA